MKKNLIWIRDQLRVRAKAIAAGGAPWVVQLAAHYGAHLSIPVAMTAITSVLAFVTTHELPNTPPTAPALPAPTIPNPSTTPEGA